nr:TetR/AcrR family transcriptional regulator [Evansella caseinilytica]
MSPRAGLDSVKIVQAASEVADRHGAEAVTIATIARKLNVRPPSLYNHVAGLRELKTMLAVHGGKQLYHSLKQEVGEQQGEEAVLALGKAYIAYTRAHPGLYEFTLRAPDPEAAELQEVASSLLQLIIDMLGTYHLEKEDILHAVRGLRSILHGFSSLEQKGGFGMPLNLDESLEYMLTSYISGVRNGGQQRDTEK